MCLWEEEECVCWRRRRVFVVGGGECLLEEEERVCGRRRREFVVGGVCLATPSKSSKPLLTISLLLSGHIYSSMRRHMLVV